MDNIETRVSVIEGVVGIADPAESDRIQREREAAAAAEVKRLSELETRLKARTASYLDAVRRAEQHARGFQAAMKEILTDKLDEHGEPTGHLSAMSKGCHAITGKASPIAFGIMNAASRFGCRHAAVQCVNGRRLGSTEWLPGHYHHDDDWVARERDLIKTHIEPIISEDR